MLAPEKKILIIPIVVKNLHTQQTPTLSMDGRNFSVSDSIFPTVAIIASLFGLLAITISLDLKEPGREERRKHQLQSAAKLLTSRSRVEQSRCGEMAYRLVPCCSLTNALKQLDD